MATRKPNSFLVLLGALALLLIVAAAFVVSIISNPRSNDLDRKRAEHRLTVRLKLDDEARAVLSSQGFVDKGKGIVRLPVTSVFSATAAELAGKAPAPSQVKVEPPLPMPAASSESSEQAPPALPSSPQGADTIRFSAPEAPGSKPSASVIIPPSATASVTAVRPPLINWTESK